MCLAVPGKIVGFHESNGVRMSKVDFGGVTREACLAYLPEAQIGDYVMVHAGFAISRLDAEEARRTYADLEELGRLAESSETDDEVP
jgi:hydrogenase expression/formation protein HypC